MSRSYAACLIRKHQSWGSFKTNSEAEVLIPATSYQHTPKTPEASHQESRHLGHPTEILTSPSSVCYSCHFPPCQERAGEDSSWSGIGATRACLLTKESTTVTGSRESVCLGDTLDHISKTNVWCHCPWFWQESHSCPEKTRHQWLPVLLADIIHCLNFLHKQQLNWLLFTR